MKLFVFSSKNLTNIWAGIGSNTWAVAERDTSGMKALVTKAKRMPIGSIGIFYCSEIQSLTTPFIIYSHINETHKVNNIWSNEWVLPFKIHPLGNPNKYFTKDEAMEILPVLKSSEKTNITHVLPISAMQLFTPKDISENDWEILLNKLCSK